MTESTATLTEETTSAINEATAAGANSESGKPEENTVEAGNQASDLDAWKAASRKWEDRAKANKAELEQVTADRAKDLERITSLEAELSALRESQADMLRETVAAVKGVPAHRITGSTREELEADAEKFLEELKTTRPLGYVPTAGTGGESSVASVVSGRERAREALGKSQSA
ncbi:hypothetical protein [Flaviflexus massiliensis]|uniref:hypothetical protein n=1 Tax=Flaviflexus massiliensis TaxID=1522309 RepID=UPI0006D553CF|nr:hypothetical protein [Flaviflexus massiliensis]